MDVTWEPPGPGRWELDRSHYPGGTTPISIGFMETAMSAGMRRVFRELGTPAETLECRFVNGFMYTRLRPLIGGSRSATKLPPVIVLKVVSRLHPAFRRSRAQMKRTLQQRPWREVVAEWHRTTRAELARQNSAFQDVELAALDDAALSAHVGALLDHCHRTFEQHFYLHGFDLGPIGMLLYSCGRWGIAPSEVLPALEGASPSTGAPGAALEQLREAVAATGRTPSSLPELRTVSPEAASLLDEYLRRRGSLLFSRYDLDGITLDEAPDVVLSTILEGRRRSDTGTGTAIATALRARVPEAERAEFDGWLDEARAAMDLRDDNGPHTVEWPAGLLRKALLEVGRRLATRGLAVDVTHVFELSEAEARTILRADPASTNVPGPAVLSERAERRRMLASLEPPLALGPIEPTPPIDALPDPLPTMIGAVNLVIAEMGLARSKEQARDPLAGSGVGTASYSGRARLATSAEDAIQAMEPGDVLIVAFTTPAYNVVLGIAGAVVTSEGGPLSHAAVLARELGIPALIGASGAMLRIADGDIVEVDPVAGRVRVLSTHP